MSLSISIKQSGFEEAIASLDRMPDSLDRAMVSGTRKSTEYVEDAYKALIPKRTGRTASTITSVLEPSPNGATGYVGTDDAIASFLEYGTRPHRIVPRDAKALRFEIGSRVIFAKGVNHPGTSAHESLVRAGQLSQPRIEQIFTTEVGEVLK